MKVIYEGHRYLLETLDGAMIPPQELQFVQRRPHHEPKPGTTNQEVCRALIDRVKVLNAEVEWLGNEQIIANLRSVIILHELRAYHRHHPDISPREAHAQVMNWLSGQPIEVESIEVGEDGHWEVRT